MFYRTYHFVQDGQENYAWGLFDQFNARGHDQLLEPEWPAFLARAYTPARYAFHAPQMGSAYVHPMAPGSTITNCAAYTSGDHLRWVTHTAYRTRAGGVGQGGGFTAFFRVVEPAVEDVLLGTLGNVARQHQDMLLGLLTQAQMRDAERHRRWVAALVQMALGVEGNRDVLEAWCRRWIPLGDAAIEAYCAALPENGAAAAAQARAAARAFRIGAGLSA